MLGSIGALVGLYRGRAARFFFGFDVHNCKCTLLLIKGGGGYFFFFFFMSGYLATCLLLNEDKVKKIKVAVDKIT